MSVDKAVEYETENELAKVFLTKLSQTIKIPEELYLKLKDKGGENVVGILPGKSKKLTLFFTKAQRILQTQLFLNKDSLNDKFFSSLRETLIQLEMPNLFSTGLCFKEEKCVWEGIFEMPAEISSLRFPMEEIQNKFKSIKFVKNAIFKEIDLIQ